MSFSLSLKSPMLVFVFFALLSLGLCEEKIIITKYGPVKGLLMRVGEQEVYSFRNIPYAKPPVGNLRFEHPQEHEGWLSEDDLDGKTKIHCAQNSFDKDEILDYITVGKEDCLVLDVYARKHHHAENISLPVLVYFHGGSFIRGSKEDYGPDYLLRYNDVILVIPNYRLGILGFLSLRDELLPGNLGVWDQHAALKWVFQNINRFGGDAQRITIAGHEAGGTSVGLHILAPASHAFFQGALSGSGTALSHWLIDTDASVGNANKVADGLRCPEDSKENMLLCIKAAPLGEILKLQGRTKEAAFLPTQDPMAYKPFMPFPPKVLYRKGYQKDVNYIVGYTENEASYEVAREFPNVLKYQHLDKMIGHFLKQYFKNFELIAKAAKYHYLRGIFIPTFESIEPRIAKIMTDFLYGSPFEQVIELHLNRMITRNIFAYKYKSEKEHYCGLDSRRCYGNEFYVFKTHSENPLDLDDEKKIETLSKIWGNFIEFGNPEAHGKWKPIRKLDEFYYAEISDIIHAKTDYRNDDTEFWNSIVSELNAAENATREETNIDPEKEFSNIDSWGAAGLVVLCGVLCIALIGVVFITKKSTLIVTIVPSHKDTKFASI